MSGTIFFFCFLNQPFQLNLLLSEFQLDQLHGSDGEKDARTEKEQRWLWRSQSRRWTWPHLSLQILGQCRVRLHLKSLGILKAPCQNDWTMYSGSRDFCAKIGHSSTRHGSSFAARDTEHFLTVSLFYLSCVVVVFFSEPRPVVHVSQNPLRRSMAGWHFYGTPLHRFWAQEDRWSTQRIK